ncbi:hypothetical protein FRB99_001025 [Tulasnella sp. 403]|nr:hypothetical protein FRB99_001025 [Tulasnella sp. 403]
MSALCTFGGIMGFVRTGSIPSVVAGVSVGALYGWSAYQIANGDPEAGLKGAFAASLLLCVSSLPRARKGPVPAFLTVTSIAAGTYYGKALRDLGLFPFN